MRNIMQFARGEGWLKSTVKFLALLVLFLPIIGGAIELASHVEFQANRKKGPGSKTRPPLCRSRSGRVNYLSP